MRLRLVWLGSVLIAAPVAHAGPWTPPAELEPRLPAACFHIGSVPMRCVQERAPGVAVNARGEALVVWSTQDDGFGLYAAFAHARGRFGRPVRLGSGLRPQALLRDDGSAVVVWTGAKTLRFARSDGGGRFAAARRLTPVVHDGDDDDGDDGARLLAQPGGGATVVYQNRQRVRPGAIAQRIRAVELPRRGRPGAPVEVSRGDLRSAAAAPGGGVAVCCTRAEALALRAAGERTWRVAPGPAEGAYLWSVAAGDDRVLTAFQGSDAASVGAFETPWAAPAGNPLLAPLGKSSYPAMLAPAIDHQDHNVLVYAERQGPASSGPLYVVSAAAGEAFGPRIRLDRRMAWDPFVAPLPAGVLIAWGANDRWGLATLRDGVLHRVRTPAGPGPSRFIGDAVPNRALATGGTYAALAWETNRGAIRASVARYP